LLTIGRVGFELGAVRHRHLDAMIVGMKIILLLHDHLTPTAAAANSAKSCGLSTGNAPVGQAPGPFRIALARRPNRPSPPRACAAPGFFGCSRRIFCSAGAVLPFWGFSGARECRRLQALRGPAFTFVLRAPKRGRSRPPAGSSRVALDRGMGRR